MRYLIFSLVILGTLAAPAYAEECCVVIDKRTGTGVAIEGHGSECVIARQVCKAMAAGNPHLVAYTDDGFGHPVEL